MRYNWHPIAASGSLPNRFEHSLVYIKDDASILSKVYVIGSREETDEGLEVFELDSKLEKWNLVPCSYDNEVTSKLVAAAKRRVVSAGIGAFVYVFGGSPDGVLRLDTVERMWCMINITGVAADLSHLTGATALENFIALFLSRNGSNDVYIFDTATLQLVSPKSIGVSPSLKSVYVVARLWKQRVLVHDGSSGMNMWFLKARPKGECVEAVSWSKCRGETTPVVICGPSGVGKGTLISMLMKEFAEKFGFSVSHTTRKPRQNELDGVHYHFTSREEMELAVSEGKFLEHAHVHGNIYGTSIAAVEAVALAGKRCILDIDVQGAKSVRRSTMEALFIFIAPPSFQELERRLRGRGTETEEQVIKRLHTAERELQLAEEEHLFDHILINDNLDGTYNQLKVILGLAECNSTQLPARSLKLITLLHIGKASQSVILADAPETCEEIKGMLLEPKEKPLPSGYNQAVHLSELEILMTSAEGGSIVVRVGK